jgi:GNAT superfamily N-acetyltransferase
MAFETEQIVLDPDLVSTGVGAVISDPAKGFYLVAASGDETVACMLITYEWSDWRNGMYLWIQSLFVSPGYRKQGVFKRLYQYAQNLVRGSDETIGLKLYVDSSNSTAQQAYEKAGMESSHYKMFHWNK